MDRPAVDTLPVIPDPAADHEQAELQRRREDIEQKHGRIREFLDATGQDAVVLGRADSVAWFTSGGDLGQHSTSECSSVLLFINRTSRAVISDNVQSSRVFEEELAGLGFQLKERPWFDDPMRAVAELCHNKRVATDLGAIGCPQWRRDGDPLRSLAAAADGAGAAAAPRARPHADPGRRGDLPQLRPRRTRGRRRRPPGSSPDPREGVVPVDLRVASDDRLARYRQPTFKAAPILKRATIAVTGRRLGLCASVTRTVSFGPVDPEFRTSHTLAAMVDATCIFFSRPGETVAEVFRRAKRIYEKFNAPTSGRSITRAC